MKAVLLDMYGVIVKQTGDDFAPYVQRTFPALKTEEIHEVWFRADVGEMTSLEVWKKLGFRGDIEETERAYLDTIEINDGFFRFAERAKEKYKLAVVSNDSSRWSRYLREKYNINRYFDAVSISGDLKVQKPDERIFRITLEQLGCEAAECIYVDDREGNLAAAAGLGMYPVLFNSGRTQYHGRSVSSFSDLEELIQNI